MLDGLIEEIYHVQRDLESLRSQDDVGVLYRDFLQSFYASFDEFQKVHCVCHGLAQTIYTPSVDHCADEVWRDVHQICEREHRVD